LALLNK